MFQADVASANMDVTSCFHITLTDLLFIPYLLGLLGLLGLVGPYGRLTGMAKLGQPRREVLGVIGACSFL